jgi:5-methylcytosine-specific restriction endonuclease McrA
VKRCTKCGEVKPLSEFSADKRRPDGKRFHCKACARVYFREYKRANGDRVRAKQAEYRDANAEQIREYKAAYYRRNPERYTAYEAKRRALKEANAHEPYSRVDIFDRWSGCCYCDGPAEELDHVTPITKGGADAERNLVPACQTCNRSKGAKTLADWAATF